MILITTPTGDIGARVLRHVLDARQDVRVILRDPAKLPEEIRSRIEVVEGSPAHAAACRGVIRCSVTALTYEASLCRLLKSTSSRSDAAHCAPGCAITQIAQHGLSLRHVPNTFVQACYGLVSYRR